MRTLLSVLTLIILSACQNNKIEVDTIVLNAKVYTVNEAFDTEEAFAITDGKFVAVGTVEAINSKYIAKKVINAEEQTIVPGFIDAHCHFYGLGMNLQKVNLVGTASFKEVIERIETFQKENNSPYILGRGWDQNDWEVKEYPNKKKLDSLFPNTPVAITRIDGHAMLCNQAALDLANITLDTKATGGEILEDKGELTGVLIDNPMELIYSTFPKPTRKQEIEGLLDAQKYCTTLGLTSVADAGLDRKVIELIDSLQQTGDLQMRVYAMVSNSEENLEYYLNKGKTKTPRLNVQSVKVYADGALGSRGATLKEPYSDQHNHFGNMVIGISEFETLATKIEMAGYQMNTHAIGDSANRFVLETYAKTLQNKTNKRWRVEHAQIITEDDFEYFKNENIIPSVQPTHATSDMYWAEERLGSTRIRGAYAYKQLLEASDKIALGTDFPIEQVSPLLTFYAAVARKDTNNYPKNGFQKENALSREETLRGMTIWAAYSNFEDQEKGSIEAGKYADFIILDNDIMTIAEQNIPEIVVLQTYINGVKQ